jgi:hypothetical protein
MTMVDADVQGLACLCKTIRTSKQRGLSQTCGKEIAPIDDHDNRWPIGENHSHRP